MIDKLRECDKNLLQDNFNRLLITKINEIIQFINNMNTEVEDAVNNSKLIK